MLSHRLRFGHLSLPLLFAEKPSNSTLIHQPKKSSIGWNQGPSYTLNADQRGNQRSGGLRPRAARGLAMKDRKSNDLLPDPMDATAAPKRKDASLGREVQAKIGQQLRAYYDGLIEPTPE